MLSQLLWRRALPYRPVLGKAVPLCGLPFGPCWAMSGWPSAGQPYLCWRGDVPSWRATAHQCLAAVTGLKMLLWADCIGSKGVHTETGIDREAGYHLPFGLMSLSH